MSVIVTNYFDYFGVKRFKTRRGGGRLRPAGRLQCLV